MDVMELLTSTLIQGLIYALISYGVYITYSILDFPDLGVDGTFPLGAAVTAVLMTKGVDPWLTLPASLIVGGLAGLFTGLVHVKLKVRNLLAGIITMTALFSVNLQIAGSNLTIDRGTDTIFTSAPVMALFGDLSLSGRKLIVSLALVIVIKLLLDAYFHTKSGLLLRAVGDTFYPLLFMIVSGALNVALNLLLVVVIPLDVAGVAIATSVSQLLSAVLVTVRLCTFRGPCRLELRKIRLYPDRTGQMLRLGFSAGLQGVLFSASNVMIQSAINSFGSTVVAGSSASSNLEGFVYTAMNAFAQAAVTFTSQNMGARKYQNLNRVVINCLLCAIVTGVVLGGGAVLAGNQLLHFYSSDAAVIAAGYDRLRIICGTYLLCGIMDVLASSLRGLGYSVLPMVVSLIGSCLLRLVWIATIFQLNRTPFMLYISYPISWVLTAAVHLACLLVVRHKMKNKLKLSID